jgi:hypothetical protein
MRDDSKTYVDESNVQVSVFSADAQAADRALAAADALDRIEDDPTLLAFDSGELLLWQRTGAPRTTPDPGFSRAGDPLGHAMLMYRALVQRTRA